MRRIQLAGTLVALVLLLCLLWSYRFEWTGLPVVRMADLRAAAPATLDGVWLEEPDGLKLRLRMDAGSPPLAVRLSLPAIPAVEHLHFRYRMSCKGLVPCQETWEDGRFIIEWHHPGETSGWESAPICSLRQDQHTDLQNVVVGPDDVPAVPMLRLEHLGRAGELVLSDLEITPIRERLLWKTGRWFLIAGWLAWLVVFLKSSPGIASWRSLAAAAIMVMTGLHFVIPGPWKIQRAIQMEFRLGNETPAGNRPDQADAAMEKWLRTIPTGVLPAMGRLPDTGSWALQVKLRISQARPFLHALLLLGPVFACACLVGRKPALCLGILLGIAVELAQLGFGYGFGWDDVLDLFNDAAGIALAMLLHRKLSARFPQRWFARTD